jgi:Fur family ferric uptake transcriptional regulator
MINTPTQLKRLTTQRLIILEELTKLKTNPTATEVYEMVRKRLPRIGLGTVYRNLELMADNGMILKIEVGGTQNRFEAITKPHYHIRCSFCGKVEDMDVEVTDDLVKTAVKSSLYKIQGHRVEFTGVCPKCQKKKLK